LRSTWVAFTSFSHTVLTIPVDSIPRFAWGRFRQVAGSLKMPLSVQGHHALMDGLHVGRYYESVQAYLQKPEGFMGDN
jgi:chloramphenicol O-acetyltransferase type A